MALRPLLLFANKVVSLPDFSYIHGRRRGSEGYFNNTLEEFKLIYLERALFLQYSTAIYQVQWVQTPAHLDLFIKNEIANAVFCNSYLDQIYPQLSKEEKDKLMQIIFIFFKDYQLKAEDLPFSSKENRKKSNYKNCIRFLDKFNLPFQLKITSSF